jgi:transcriptional regulator with XRE-family HTH domain
MQNRGYNAGYQTTQQGQSMPKQTFDKLTGFGKRLSALRKTAGYTQTELAEELEVSQRMISYYEGQSEYPPAAMLPKLANLLGVTSDELLGIEPIKKIRQPDTRLVRRISQIDKLEPSKKKQLLNIIDTFIEAEQLKQQA